MNARWRLAKRAVMSRMHSPDFKPPRFHQKTRCVTTETIEAPLVFDNPLYFERPGTIVLAESLLQYESSWSRGRLGHEFANRGIPFSSTNFFPESNEAPSLVTCDRELARDVELIPNCILIARGALPSLVAQYYLESRALIGLVMIDPLIDPRSPLELRSSTTRYMEMTDGIRARGGDRGVIMEQHILNQLLRDENHRLLKLEAGSVPMLVLYSTHWINRSTTAESISHHDDDVKFIQKNVETISAHHSDQYPVRVKCLDNQKNNDDDMIDQVVDEVYGWIDDDCILG